MEYHIISDIGNEDFKLNIGVDDRGNFFMPSLTFEGIKDEYGSIYWDNEDYIFGEFYEFLKRYIHRTLKETDVQEFVSIWEIMDQDNAETLLTMLDRALEKGWYIKPVKTIENENR